MPTVTSKDGAKISYDIKGKGPAVILVAGATQHRAIDEQTPIMAEMLSDRFTIINYDRRGRGESTDGGKYAVAREIEDIAALIEAAGGSAALYGMSSGCVLALEAAAALPNVTKVFGYEPPVDPEEKEANARKGLAEMEALAAKGQGAAMMEKFMGEVGMPPDQLEGFKQSPGWPAYASVGHTLAYDYRIMAEAIVGDRLPERWKNIRVPVMIANGDASYGFMGPGADYVARAIPGAKRQTLPGQSHEVDPKVLVPVLTEFFSS
jgi:pimeloyl-ACP methyl ester carboxylesterase